MADVTLEQRFRGAVRLATLHLWRVAKSTDLDQCFAAARERSMIDGEQEAFLRECIRAERLLDEGGELPVAPDEDTIRELQRCTLRLNTADPA